jgi:hypothetical protein
MEQVQRSVEWYQLRLGRFTASEITRLLGKLTTKQGQEGFESYCMEKATEAVFGMVEDDYQSFDMLRGVENEPYAFDDFWQIMGEKFIEVKKSGFITYGDHAGASPDGVVGINDSLEIKCPTMANFGKKYLKKEIPEKDFNQIQMQLLCLGGDKGYYHNYAVHQGVSYSFTIEVPRNEEVITVMRERIVMGTELKLKYIEQLKQLL